MEECILMKNSAGCTPFHMACELFMKKVPSIELHKEIVLFIFQYALTKGQGSLYK